MKKIVALFILMTTIGYVNAQIIKMPIPDKLVVLTFDDATASQYSIVAPLLEKFGFGGTFFICEFQPNFKDSSKYMNWRQIAALNRMGFEIANHTRHHEHINSLSKEKAVEVLKYIDDKCDSLDIPKPTNFAYPGYGLNLSALEVLKEEGYHFARAGGSRAYNPVVDHPLLIPSWAMNSENKQEIMQAFSEAKEGKIVVLTIHGVPDVEHPWVTTPPELFEEYLTYLSGNGFSVISLNQLDEYIDVKEAVRSIIPDFTKPLKN
ncbi:polysaccharide deacetylase family protein [Mangrovibacterium lignilyticum]|uniref:polysaccharide deacetylase family protein n=1 Tax=Mangrovibacterium lignilyticum TaxID=2668052 RepID=UPI0013D402E2|nr:polysaccharide deacetylase family protein [Mangrovibacterium lignilyticum]